MGLTGYIAHPGDRRRERITVPTTKRPGIPNILRSIAGWLVLVVFGVVTWIEYGPGNATGYTPAPIRFVVCGSLATVVGVVVAYALASGFAVVLLIESLFGRTIFSKARLGAIVVVG